MNDAEILVMAPDYVVTYMVSNVHRLAHSRLACAVRDVFPHPRIVTPQHVEMRERRPYCNAPHRSHSRPLLLKGIELDRPADIHRRDRFAQVRCAQIDERSSRVPLQRGISVFDKPLKNVMRRVIPDVEDMPLSGRPVKDVGALRFLFMTYISRSA